MSNYSLRIPSQLLLPWSPQKTISTAHAADILKCSTDTVIRMIEAGELKGYQLRKLARSPYRVYYDSVVSVAERIHGDADMEKRF